MTRSLDIEYSRLCRRCRPVILMHNQEMIVRLAAREGVSKAAELLELPYKTLRLFVRKCRLPDTAKSQKPALVDTLREATDRAFREITDMQKGNVRENREANP